MKYSTDVVIKGLINYADNEIMHELPTSIKWVLGTALGIAATKIKEIIDALKENAIIRMLGVIDEDGNIDVDIIIFNLKESAEKYGSVTFDIPFVGRLTFSATDIESLRSYIG